MFEYDKIVVGSSLRALLYAFSNNYPVFFAQEQRPFQFDHLDPAVDLSCLKIPGAAKSLTTFGGAKLVGQPKEILWERLLFLLSLSGNAPLSNLCHNMRYDDNTVVCSNEYSKIAEFSFNECFYFGDAQATGFLEQKRLDEDTYICYDYIAFNKGGKHQADYIQTEDDFVGEIWFYPSNRIDGNTAVKDACAVSILTKNQLLDFDYSETMARFKAISEMESRGMKGLLNGYGPNGRPKHYKFRTTHITRRAQKNSNPAWIERENIQAPSVTTEDLLTNLSTASLAYDRFLKYL